MMFNNMSLLTSGNVLCDLNIQSQQEYEQKLDIVTNRLAHLTRVTLLYILIFGALLGFTIYILNLLAYISALVFVVTVSSIRQMNRHKDAIAALQLSAAEMGWGLT